MELIEYLVYRSINSTPTHRNTKYRLVHLVFIAEKYYSILVLTIQVHIILVGPWEVFGKGN